MVKKVTKKEWNDNHMYFINPKGWKTRFYYCIYRKLNGWALKFYDKYHREIYKEGV